MDTALLAYSGISVKMMVDRVFGADHVTMFTVDYELGRRGPGARPPVRGGLRLPRRRGRGRARRRALHPAPGRHRLRRGRLGPRLLQRRAPSASAGSRPRRPSRPPGTPIAGCRAGNATTRDARRKEGADMADGRRGRHRRRDAGHRAGDRPPLREAGGEVVLTGRDPATSRPRSRNVGGRTTGASPSTWPSRRASPRRSRASGRSSAWCSSPSTATRTPSPTTTSPGPSGS